MTAESLRAQRIVRASVAAILGTALCGFAPAAFAQQTQQTPRPQAAEEELEEVQITGTRILRRDLESTSPLVTIGQETFDEISNVAVEAALNKLPQFFPGLDQFDTADIQLSARSTVGATNVNLRNLGPNRNLVLVNGRRSVPINSAMVTDLNSIPSAALSRVEIITGGASSVYGADAVAGVVNFILRENFQGADVDVQYGQTQLGDGGEFRGAALIGGNFADDRGNAMLGFEYTRREEVLQIDRDFYRWQLTNPYQPGQTFSPGMTQYVPDAFNPPAQAIIDQIFAQAPPAAPGGIGVGNTNTFTFQPDGTAFTYNDNAGTYRYNGEFGLLRKVTNTGTIAENSLTSRISSPLSRYSLFGAAHFDLTEKVTAYAQGTFSQAETQQILDYAAAFGAWGATVPHGSGRNCQTIGVTTGPCDGPAFANMPTLPLYQAGGAAGLSCPPVGGCTNSQAFPTPPELTLMLDNRTVNPNADWTINRQLDFFGDRRSTRGETTQFQLVAGLRGDLPIMDWTWDAYASHGTSRNDNQLRGVSTWSRFRALIRQPNYGRGATITGNSGTPGNGNNAATVTCESGLPIFEQFEVSEDCARAIRGDLDNITKTEQSVIEATIQGGLFELPGGELRFAAGGVYRENSFAFNPSLVLSNGSFVDGVIGLDPIAAGGANDQVKEGYVEFLVPVIKDKPFFTHLNLELGYRTSDYTSTGRVGTWKALLDWAFTPDLRLRGGVQRATRSPNLAELYSPISDTFSFGPGDPCSEGFFFNYGAAVGTATNPKNNPEDAAAVRRQCEAMMGPEGAAQFYANPATPQIFPFDFVFQREIGNPNVRPEAANTYTAGLVFRSPFQSPVASFTTSLDWYSINVEDAIALTGLTTLNEQCFSVQYNPTHDPNNPFCLLLPRNTTTGGRLRPQVTWNNVGKFEVAGLDWSFNWAAAFEDMGVSFIPGRLSFGLSANYTLHDRRQDFPNTPVQNNTGYVGFTPPWQAFTSLGYSVGGFNASLRMRHYPALDNLALRNNPASQTQGVGSYQIYDLSASYFFGRQLSVRMGIDNLMDIGPPVDGYNPGAGGPGTTGYSTGSLATNNIYDTLGRRFYVGMKLTF